MMDVVAVSEFAQLSGLAQTGILGALLVVAIYGMFKLSSMSKDNTRATQEMQKASIESMREMHAAAIAEMKETRKEIKANTVSMNTLCERIGTMHEELRETKRDLHALHITLGVSGECKCSRKTTV